MKASKIVKLLALSKLVTFLTTLPAQTQTVERYTATIPSNYDRADIYFPQTKNTTSQSFPAVLFLPGALVNKVFYSDFAKKVARKGFIVVVPNHYRTISQANTGGLFAQTSQIKTILEYLKTENTDADSPIHHQVNVDKLVLMGHSHGGAVGLTAIENLCRFPFCTQSEFTLPDAVVAGVFYGTHQKNLKTGNYRVTNNNGIPVALISGSEDGVATPEEIQNTYTRIEDKPNALISIKGVNHYGLTNMNNPIGAKPDSQQPTINQDKAIKLIAKWSVAFAQAYAYDDLQAWQQIYCQKNHQFQSVNVVSKTNANRSCEELTTPSSNTNQ
jgi:dienelactone hydrolase